MSNQSVKGNINGQPVSKSYNSGSAHRAHSGETCQGNTVIVYLRPYETGRHHSFSTQLDTQERRDHFGSGVLDVQNITRHNFMPPHCSQLELHCVCMAAQNLAIMVLAILALHMGQKARRCSAMMSAAHPWQAHCTSQQASCRACKATDTLQTFMGYQGDPTHPRGVPC